MRNKRPLLIATAAAAAPVLLLLPSCARVTVDPIEVKPIHITMDINVKVDRQLDEFFAFENKYQAPATTQSATQPAAAVVAPAADPALATLAAAAQPSA